MIQKLKGFIQGLQLEKSDIFLLIGFIFSVPFYAFAWKYMVETDLSKIFFKDWMTIVCFSVVAICWGFYFYFEAKKGRLKNNAALWVWIFVTIIGFVGVLVQPAHISNMVECKKVGMSSYTIVPDAVVGGVYEVTYDISGSHRLFFAFATLCIPTIYFILLTLLPKRITSMNFLVFCGICVFIFLFFIAGYSYIFEASKYVAFIKAFLAGDSKTMYEVAPISLLTHRVPYGVCMMLGFMFSLILHTITKKKYWFIFTAFTYINIFFTWTKTSLLLATFIFVVYIILLLLESFKEHKKRNTIIFVSGAGVVFLVGVLTLISVLTHGAFLSPLNYMVETFTKAETLTTRSYIWGNINTLLSNGWIWIGRGFGTYNSMLFPMNILNDDVVCPSHSSYYAVLGQGGIFTLICFLAAYIYYGYIFVKCFKINKHMTMQLSVGFLVFVLYSFTEGINYLLIFFMFPLLLYYGLYKRGLVKQEN